MVLVSSAYIVAWALVLMEFLHFVELLSEIIYFKLKFKSLLLAQKQLIRLILWRRSLRRLEFFIHGSVKARTYSF